MRQSFCGLCVGDVEKGAGGWGGHFVFRVERAIRMVQLSAHVICEVRGLGRERTTINLYF